MEWSTPHTIIYEDHALFVRQFRGGEGSAILPPQAGHGGEVADWPVKGRSLVQSLLDNTSGGVYVVDFKSCTYARRNEDYYCLIMQVYRALSHIPGPVNLFGLCQGGTLATIYTALFPTEVSHLIPIGCPIDTRAAKSSLDVAMQMPLAFYRLAVAAQGGIVRGEWMLANWKSGNWADHYIGRYTEPSEKKELFYSWYDETRNIPGVWYLELIDQLFVRNLLIKNEFKVGDWTVDLRKIKCPVSMITGEKDNISPPAHLFSLQQHVPHATRHTVKGAGHIACFNSLQANSVTIPQVCLEIEANAEQRIKKDEQTITD